MRDLLRSIHQPICVALLSLSAFWCNIGWTEESLVANPNSDQTSFFSDENVSYQIDFGTEQPIEGVIQWQLTVLHRTFGRGDIQIDLKPEQRKSVTLNFQMPHVKTHVIQESTLSLRLAQAGNGDAVTIFQRGLWAFPRDAFADRNAWLNQLDLRLYDPVGDTAKVLDEAEIPFQEIRSIAALATIENGIVIIGEGIEVQSNSGLAETLFSLCADGQRILWFSPANGHFGIPGIGDDSEKKRPDHLLLMGSDRLWQLDKRLDTFAWTAEDHQGVGLQLADEGGRIVIKFVEPPDGWTWLEATFRDTDGQLILCGLQLAEVWNVSPTPRYMLARLLEQLDNSQKPEEQETEK
ncbi:hypothetical protein Q31b_08340 [Novipirellula aureliae]|uniref:Uncharacterized protein n=1 Tax=Novipirellula aureliae TaxID=2527966 RepID=A0A5C6E9Y2_9BACT|nr:hypothetical protein [Novipirellula aureliae]TWU45658.1 hypothetical protein Q31b_08340 [Novipirellula aureliae]